jgi:hypothetical protein
LPKKQDASTFSLLGPMPLSPGKPEWLNKAHGAKTHPAHPLRAEFDRLSGVLPSSLGKDKSFGEIHCDRIKTDFYFENHEALETVQSTQVPETRTFVHGRNAEPGYNRNCRKEEEAGDDRNRHD